MKILVSGGTGLLGSHLVRALSDSGNSITVLTRRKVSTLSESNVRFVFWNGWSAGSLTTELEQSDAVINLAGVSIGEGRWTAKRKRAIEESRIISTEALVEGIKGSAKRPKVLLSASAVGYYGECGDDPVFEQHHPGNDFLARLCVRWESTALRAVDLGVRVVIPRTAMVLASSGGALQRIALPFRMFLGGALGSGKQWFPWIHIDDVVDAIRFALATAALSGPFNLASPGCVTMDQFACSLGETLRRPHALRVPAGILSIVLGEMAHMILASQRVIPAALLRNGFQFRFPELGRAFTAISSL